MGAHPPPTSLECRIIHGRSPHFPRVQILPYTAGNAMNTIAKSSRRNIHLSGKEKARLAFSSPSLVSCLRHSYVGVVDCDHRWLRDLRFTKATNCDECCSQDTEPCSSSHIGDRFRVTLSSLDLKKSSQSLVKLGTFRNFPSWSRGK